MIDTPLTLHDALTHSECIVCGTRLQWNLGFNKDLNQPLYTSMHCNFEYEIAIERVRIKAFKPLQQPGEKEIVSKEGKEANKEQQECEPRAILLAKALKEKREKEQETQNKDKTEEEETIIEELESQDLKECVPVGGEEFENEEPRQG